MAQIKNSNYTTTVYRNEVQMLINNIDISLKYKFNHFMHETQSVVTLISLLTKDEEIQHF